VTVFTSKPDLKAFGLMFLANDSACLATDEIVEADLRFDDQSDTGNPFINEDVFNPLPNLPNREAAPKACVALNLETLPSQSGNLNEEFNAPDFSAFPSVLELIK